MKSLQTILDKNKEFMIIPDGIIVFNCEGQIIAINEAAERITGYSEEEAISKDYHEIFSAESMKIDHMRDVIDKGSAYSNLPIDIICSNDKKLNVLSSLTPITKSDNTITSVIFVFRNTAEIISLAETLDDTTRALLDERNKLEAIFNSTLEGTFTIDNDWTITSFNTAAETITGYKRSEAMGRKCWDIFKSGVCRNGCHMETTIAKNKHTIGNELAILTKSGKETPIRVNSAPLLNSSKQQIGAVETFLDITEIKNLSDQLIDKYQYEHIIGKSVPMQKVFSLLENVAQTDCSVLITGESGTGKELIARAIHFNSTRKTGPFAAINCSAFAESIIESELFGHEKGAFTGALKTKVGKFELAQGGTLFLDEIG
ncbi:MAG TPA: sigma 54-interacting transcriptional regulator, partial [Ignavibacteriales bacterium]|nr:sigma 54-interacting transcriptional regulator [Ignavibacteriales bacterium]